MGDAGSQILNCKLFKRYFMNEEVLNVLVDKTVDNGKAIREVQEQIKGISPNAVIAGVDQRIGRLEELVAETSRVTGERMVELASKVDSVGSAVGGMAMEVSGPGSRVVSQMWSLEKSMNEHVALFKNPMTKEVHHRHFVGPVVWVLLVMGVMIVSLGVALTRSWDREAQYEQHDILWRSAVQVEDSVVLGALHKVEKDYAAGEEQFRKDVVDEERRRAELYEHWWSVQKEKERIKELENEKKKR